MNVMSQKLADSASSSVGATGVTSSVKDHRVLACLPCQRRKIKCDRKIPCTHCVRTQAECVPATLAPRRRRFAERQLLDRLRKYEDLLRQNKVLFEPLHQGDLKEENSPVAQDTNESTGESSRKTLVVPSSSSTTNKDCKKAQVPKDIWQAMTGDYLSSDQSGAASPESLRDNMREAVLETEWDEISRNNGHLLFGTRNGERVDLSTLHPLPVHLFRLWQIYLENVDPLLKVTHTPTMQSSILEAASNLTDVPAEFEVLMFSIYCTAVLSLDQEMCLTVFQTSRAELLTRYQFACQQALLNADFLRTRDRNCLSAFFLYLLSVRSTTDPFYLSTLLGMALRIGRRVGIHSEASNSKCNAFEAEVRRRLWWALVLFDARISEMTLADSSNLSPVWDCKIPRNLNDSDLRPGLVQISASWDMPTDALFAVVRATIGNSIRGTAFHLEFTNPALKALSRPHERRPHEESQDVTVLERLLKEKHLNLCNEENPLHFMTIWSARTLIAKYHLTEHYSNLLNLEKPPSPEERDMANQYAIDMLSADTTLLSNSLVKGFLWMIELYYPFPAMLQLFQDLKKRPFSKRAKLAWKTLSENYSVRHASQEDQVSPLFRIVAAHALQAWEACVEARAMDDDTDTTIPEIVTRIKEALGRSVIAEDGEMPADALESNQAGPPVTTSAGVLNTTGMSSSNAQMASYTTLEDQTWVGGIDLYPLHWNNLETGLMDFWKH